MKPRHLKFAVLLSVCLLPALLVAIVASLVVAAAGAAGIALYLVIDALIETLLFPYRVWQCERAPQGLSWPEHIVHEDLND